MPTERRTFNLSPRKLRNYDKHLGVDDYAHVQVVRYAMTQYSPRKDINKFKKVKEAEVENDLKKLHTKITFTPTNVSGMSEQQK